MNFIRHFLKRAERRLLVARIVRVRPDLKGAHFLKQIRTYAHDALDAHIEAESAYYAAYHQADEADRDQLEEPVLPELVKRCLAYEALHPIGHYMAELQLLKRKYDQLDTEHDQQHLELMEQWKENREARKLAREAVDLVTNAIGPQVREN